MTASKIPAIINELADKLGEKMSFVDGKMTIDQDAYVSCLPEDLSVEMVRKLHEYNTNFYPAATKAFGEKVIPEMKADKKLDVVSLEIPLFDRDHLDLGMRRERNYTIPKSDSVGTTLGYVDASLVTQAAQSGRGAMKHVREHLTAEAMKAFGA